MPPKDRVRLENSLALKDIMSDLTNKQAMFCKEYLIDLNATQAAIRAGYSEDSAAVIGCENLIKPNVQEEIQKLMSERSKKIQITANDVLSNIKNIGERCMQEVEVIDKDGHPTGTYVFKENGALKAQELLGRHIKLFGADGSTENPYNVIMPTIKSDGKEKEYNIGNNGNTNTA